MSNVLIITGDPLGAKLAGPAIRAWNMARVLSASNDVVLMTTTTLEPELRAGFRLELVRPGGIRSFAKLEKWADVIVFQGHALNQFPALRKTKKFLVADIYDPMHLEMLEQGKELPVATWRLMVETATKVLNQQLARADFFLCSSERQRFFYLGQLATLGRLTPEAYSNDPHFRKLIELAPFGLNSKPPVHEREVLRGMVAGIDRNDKILIWGGGIYNWFDPKTLIRSVAVLKARNKAIRLYFLGTKHPGVERMGIVGESVDLAEQLGLLNSEVFFNSDWVKFDDRQDYLTEANAGVSTHHSHVETTFSFRTRILDYLWAGLPMVVTEGDSFAELVKKENLGVVVPAEDEIALAAGIEKVLYDEKFAAEAKLNVERIAKEFTWERVLKPLTDFVNSPRHATDHPAKRHSKAMLTPSKPYGVIRNFRMAIHYLKHHGRHEALRKIRSGLGSKP